jgi:hypothetical protein
VEDESEPLGRGQCVEDDEQGQTDRIGQKGLLLGVVNTLGGDIGLGEPGADRILAPRLPRPQLVEREARDDGRKPAAHVLDRLGVGAVDAQPGLLEHVVGIGERAQHAVGDCPQVPPVSLELLGLPVAPVRCHIVSLECVIEMTNGDRPM